MKTPYQKALAKVKNAASKEKEEKKRNFCIDQRICPDCGEELHWRTRGDYLDEIVCDHCPSFKEEHSFFFGLFRWTTVAPAVKRVIYY